MKTLICGVVITILAVAVLVGKPAVGHAATFTVTSVGDEPDAKVGDGICTTATGVCTLRAAIAEANATSGADVISFNIPGSTPVFTIAPASQLPDVTETVAIDGYTQPGARPNSNGTGFGANTLLKIEINGMNAFDADGLTIRANNTTIRGLAINRFRDNGIVLSNVQGSRVEGNFIGTDISGSIALGNGQGVWITDSWDNRVGGATPDARNVISANAANGISIEGARSTGNLVQGNLIGTDKAGYSGLRHTSSGNPSTGVSIDSGAHDNRIGGALDGARNILSGNGIGVSIRGLQTTGNQVEGNYIGTDINGAHYINITYTIETCGIEIVGAPGNTGGGTAVGAGNVISGNTQSGIRIVGPDATTNRVQGNVIGTDYSGMSAIGNFRGVQIDGAPRNILSVS